MGAKIESAPRRITSRHVNTFCGGPKQSEPGLGLDFQINALGPVEIVAYHDRQGNLVAFSEHTRRVVFDKEKLEGFDLFFHRANSSIFSRSDHGQLPGRDVIGEFELQLRVPLRVRFQRWLPQKSFGEVLTEARRGHLWSARLRNDVDIFLESNDLSAVTRATQFRGGGLECLRAGRDGHRLGNPANIENYIDFQDVGYAH